ncbi:helix-turn-helix domain-containing protein [Sandarakinorhabdus sp. DWP1-3-1]|uniref:helix-turn-helix domain-containing protein n=1 Tax=Sandarakinorhabdus sp. DWP1-3-1 TaxID=2804627 RepID=UPI003CF254BE
MMLHVRPGGSPVLTVAMPCNPFGLPIDPASVPAVSVRTAPPSFAELVRFAEEYADLRRGTLCGPARHRDAAWPRQALMLAVRRERPQLSLPTIGRRLGGRDHTTVLHGVRAAAERCAADPDFAEMVAAFSRKASL